MIYLILAIALIYSAIAFAWWRANRELKRIQELLDRDVWN
jgi:hypothetical protein